MAQSVDPEREVSRQARAGREERKGKTPQKFASVGKALRATG